jgi:hypothetical protein
MLIRKRFDSGSFRLSSLLNAIVCPRLPKFHRFNRPCEQNEILSKYLWMSYFAHTGGSMPLGSIQFLGVNISVTNGKVDRYFNFADGSSKGVEKMVFKPGNLSGASQVPPNGLVQAAGFNTVDQ